jgi:hypothetical protein
MGLPGRAERADSEVMDGVTATLNYLAPGSAVNRLYVAPGDQLATTRYEPRTVEVSNGRPRRKQFTLDGTGFTLADHRSALTGPDGTGLADTTALDEIYTPEALGLVRKLTGADHVVSLGWMMRRTGTQRNGALPPAPDVHTDLHTCAIARRYAEVHAKSPLPPEGSCWRAVYTSLWRAFSPPPQDWPLALCDYRSVGDDEGTPNLLFRVRELPAPEQAETAADDAEAESAASVFEYRPAHRWWYFPGMHAGEVLIIKLHDTDHSVAWRAPHTSFHDTTTPGTHPRESVELRTVAFFR